ncbi:MAG: hypothetical protein M3R35_08185 [Candidatus Eremiobacteraeota bacterium]|nr:hypothetical protein [Candidatus Eremiobacteraeota bacterium]
MTQDAQIEGTFKRAWGLLAHNPIIVVPALIVGLLTALLLYALDVYAAVSIGPLSDLSGGGPAAFASFLGSILAITIRLVAATVSIAYTTGMAAAAWETGRATLADGARAVRRFAPHIALAIVLLFLIGVVAAVLADFTFYLTLLLYAVFVIYTMPAVIVGERTGVEGLIDSFTIAAKNFWATVGIVLLILLIAIAGAIIARLVHGVPLVGQIVEVLLTEATVAYATLVAVGEYRVLREKPAS